MIKQKWALWLSALSLKKERDMMVNWVQIHLQWTLLVTAYCLVIFGLFIRPTWPDSQLLSFKSLSPLPKPSEGSQTPSLITSFPCSQEIQECTVLSKITGANPSILFYIRSHEVLITGSMFIKLFIVLTVWSIFLSGYPGMNHWKLDGEISCGTETGA